MIQRGRRFVNVTESFEAGQLNCGMCYVTGGCGSAGEDLLVLFNPISKRRASA